MSTSPSRALNRLLNILILISALCAVYIMYAGGIDLRIRLLPQIRLSSHNVRQPLTILLILALVKCALNLKDPLTRLRNFRDRHGRTVLLSLVVLVTAGIPRLWDLNGHSMNPDAMLWIDRGHRLVRHLQAGEFIKATERLGHPGLIPAALMGVSYLYLGDHTSPTSLNRLNPIVAARLPIAILGTATCLLLYLIGRIAFGDATAFWAAVFLSLFPSHVDLSRNAHIDSTLTLFFTLSILLYLAYTEQRRMGWKVASSVAFAFALLTKSPAVLVPVILFLWKALARGWDRRRSLALWEPSDLGWLGLALAIHFTLFTKLWSDPSQLIWVKSTKYLPQVVPVSRAILMISSFPWIPVTAALIIILAVAGMRRGRGVRELLPARPRIMRVLLLILLILSFVQLFQRPIANELLHTTRVYHVMEMGHLKDWMGNLVSRPPRWFYLFMLGICTPPLILLLAILGIGRVMGMVRKRAPGWSPALLSLVTPAVFIGVMSMGHKMGFRYIDPAMPFVCLLAAIALGWIINAIACRVSPERSPAAATVLNAIACIVIAAAIVPPLMRVAPDYEIYCNMLVGGPRGVSRFTPLGSRTGTREAAACMKSRAREDDSIFVFGNSAEFRYYWDNEKPSRPCHILINQGHLPQADWIILPHAERVRIRDQKQLDMIDALPLAYAFTKCGVDFIRIYRHDIQPLDEGRSFTPREMKSAMRPPTDRTGAPREDTLESGHRKGMLASGPYARLAAGGWRASFMLGARDATPRQPVARISVTGLAAEEALRSRDLSGDDFEKDGQDRAFTLDFTLKNPRRVQFCVYAHGTSDLVFKGVSLERR